MPSSVGTSTFAILRNIIVPNTLKDISYEDLLKKKNSQCPSKIGERFKFQKQLRKQGQKIADFVRNLRRLSELCNFGNTLNDRLRDQLVFCIENRLLNTAKIVRF